MSRRGEGIALAPTEADYRVMASPMGVAPLGLVLAYYKPREHTASALVCSLQRYTALVLGRSLLCKAA